MAELVKNVGAGCNCVVNSRRERMFRGKAVGHAGHRYSVLKCQQLADTVMRFNGANCPTSAVKIATKDEISHDGYEDAMPATAHMRSAWGKGVATSVSFRIEVYTRHLSCV
jgi:hypothetical protein